MESKEGKFEILNDFMLIVLIIVSIYNMIFKEYHTKTIAYILFAVNIIYVFKYRRNKYFFVLAIIIWYFNYSVLIVKYFTNSSTLLNGIYSQLKSLDTIGIGINVLLLFNLIIYLVIGNVNTKNDINIQKMTLKIMYSEKINILLIGLKIILVFILAYHLIKKITYNTVLFEYSFILYIIALFISKENKKEKRSFEILLIFYCIYSLYIGERIAVLQLIIVEFVINYIDKFSAKQILICILCGICFFTFIGVYGDILDSNQEFKNLTIENVYDAFKERKFALDTSVSSYFSSQSMIECSKYFSNDDRIHSFINYVLYIFIGKSSDYENVSVMIQKYQINYGGGFITGYFYFWGGIIGVMFIGYFIGKLFKKIKKADNGSSDYIKILLVYALATIPRWYLYEPTLLFRGILFLTILYFIIKILFNKKMERRMLI